MHRKHKIAVFASGYGSNFEVITRAAQAGDIPAEVVLMVCDKPSARVCGLADELGVEKFVFAPKDYESKSHYEQEIVRLCRKRGVELICLAGYMRLVGEELLGAYRGQIINLHPSLLPAFAGVKPIESAMEYGVKVYGVTIHYVDATLDGGKMISQVAVPYEGDNIEELEAMIHKAEHKLYVETINKI